MAFGLRGIVHGKKALRRTFSGLKEAALKSTTIPKCYFAVYVGEGPEAALCSTRVVPQRACISRIAKYGGEEFGYGHPMGGLTIPCSKDIFIDLTSQLNGL